jgi:hypothetical protein
MKRQPNIKIRFFGNNFVVRAIQIRALRVIYGSRDGAINMQ